MIINKKFTILIVFLLIILFLPVDSVYAELEPINFSFNVPLPGFPADLVIDNSVLPNYITWLYKFVFAVAGLLAVFMITIGGVIWIFAGGNSAKVSQAKEYITGAVTGLLLALFSYSILYIINPVLVMNSFPQIINIGKADLYEIDPVQVQSKSNLKLKSQECLLKEFGKTASEIEKQLVRIDCSALGTITVHKKAETAFKAACAKIPKNAKTVCGNPIKNGGTFCWRNIRKYGPNQNCGDGVYDKPLSAHSFATAIDISPQDCYNTSKYKPLLGINDYTKEAIGKSNLPKSVVDAFKSAGFRWGGDYTSVGDNMHFEWFGNCFTNNGTNQSSSSLVSTNVTAEWISFNISDDGSKIYYPKNYKYVTPKKLVVFYHGLYLEGFNFEKYCDMAKNSVAGVSKDDYVVACVKGSGAFKGKDSTTWNSDLNGVIKGYTSAVNHYKYTINTSANKIFVAGHSRAYEVLNYLPTQSSITGSVEKYIWLDANYGTNPLNCNISLTGVATSLESRCDGKIIKATGSHLDAIGYLGNFIK